MKKYNQIITLTIILLLFSILSFAQINDTLFIQKNTKGEVCFVRFMLNENSQRKMNKDTLFLKSFYKTKQNDSFHKIQEGVLSKNVSFKKFQQYYKGLPIDNAQIIIHGRNNIIEVVNGDFQSINIQNIHPTLNEKQALHKALAFVGAKKYKWEDKLLEAFLKEIRNNIKATYFPQGELTVAQDDLDGSNMYKLSWKFTISSLDPDYEQIIYIDAHNGDIIKNISLVHNTNISCVAQTMYSEDQTIIGDSFTGGIRLQENRSGVNLITMNVQSTTSTSNAIPFTNANINWTASSWVDFNRDQAALDAHWGAERVLDYWDIVHERNSINDDGLPVISYVHWGDNWGNAQWVGGNSNYMRYGDNNGLPLTTLDIVAHEFGHKINEYTADLTSGTAESGALNEGFSDIWGACIEYWAAPNKHRWLIGENVFVPMGFSCLRNLQNPKDIVAAEGQHPNTYNGDFWRQDGEPHFNSTVLSHWFYLISEGGNGHIDDNSNNDYYEVYPIGIENSQKIAYTTLQLLTSNADYSDARNVSIQAAIYHY